MLKLLNLENRFFEPGFQYINVYPVYFLFNWSNLAFKSALGQL
jgi:hypothetical protein